MAYEPVIGLEIHVQLKTRSKMFCGNAVEFGAEPNTHVCPVCLGLPGALPVVNAEAVDLGIRAGLGLGCTVHEASIFARKNYFYPDLPKGYQITQFDRPLATDGGIDVDGDDGLPAHRVRIRRIHLEEDAGKSLHDRLAGRTAVDLNRAGVPLVEIVTEPDLASPAQARAFLARLKQTLEYLDVSDCDMEKGSLRVDANVSIRPAGSAGLGTKTEVKNMNSFANVERALNFEIRRQTELVEAGGTVVQETLLWDQARGEARAMRSKEESHDYRYFPDPDLPPLVLDARQIDAIRAALPELPDARRRRFLEQYGLPTYDAEVLTAAREVADYFEAAAAAVGDPKAASNWVMTDVLGWINQRQCALADLPVTPARLAELIGLVTNGTLSTTLARQVFSRMAETGEAAAAIVQAEGLAQVRDAAQLEAWAEEVVAAHPDEAERYRQGEARLLGFFMGQLMKRSQGKADPRQATALLKARLEG
ncbi:MAG TPA: Asp-tRNA(Asn)/Glu-tRNA(Gln) amidotransferase subunit GatB [Longimicrobiales bacterium]|nr:Asp-tRNA(Asn)/Glu-tRNA(Gln) amidotransferase subunit GatB [Longimicrobiales bacterium]